MRKNTSTAVTCQNCKQVAFFFHGAVAPFPPNIPVLCEHCAVSK